MARGNAVGTQVGRAALPAPPPNAERAPGIIQVSEDLAKAVDYLSEEISYLENKLDPITTVADKLSGDLPVSGLCDVEMKLNSVLNHVSILQNRICSLRERVRL
jgi:hypothetical protein